MSLASRQLYTITASLLFSLFFGLSSLPIFGAEVLSDVQFPKAPAYRVGISELPERQYVQAIEEKNKQADI